MGIYKPQIRRYFTLPQIKVLDKYDVIVTSAHWQISELRYIGYKRDNIINIIHHPHTNDVKFLDEEFLNSKHINIAASRRTSNKCKKLGITINKMIYTGGVDREIYKFRNKRLSNNIGFFYYNHPRKMPEFICAVIDLLLTKKPSFEILVFGNGYKNQGVTVFEGLREIDYADAISQVGLFVYISSEEGFGLPPLEAMAAGIPVLSSKVGAITEYGREAIEFIDPTLSPEQVAFKILNLVNDEELRIKLGSAGDKYSNKWTWRTCAENYDTIIHRILENNKRSMASL
jgi:glycosyltransferase involved in cell wall biosynthesis